MKKIFLPIMLCALMVLSSVLLACEPIGEHKHELFEVPQVEATCSEDGIRKHRECRICRYWFDEEGNLIDEREFIIPATGVHKFVEVPKVEATCGEAGVDAHRECEQCDKWFDADGNQIDKSSCTIPATNNHHFENGTCTVCGAEDPTWEGPEEPEITLPEGLAGKYLDSENKENYVQVLEDKSVKTHIDNEDTTFTVTKVEGNKVTLNSNDVIEFNAEEYSITYNGKTYILDTKYPAEPEPEIELPEGLVGKYFDENDKENYIEVLEDKSVKVHIDNEDTTFTVTKVEDNTVTLDNEKVIEFNADAGSVTYNDVTYYDEKHYPDEPELVVPEVFNGTFVNSKVTYIFDGTVNVTIRNMDGTTENWEIIEASVDGKNSTVKIKSKDDEEKEAITLVNKGSKSLYLGNGGTAHANKATAATNIPANWCGKYEYNSTTYLEFTEDGYVIRTNSGSPQQFLIDSYDEAQNKVHAQGTGAFSLTYDNEADTFTTGGKTYTRVKDEPEVISGLEWLVGEWVKATETNFKWTVKFDGQVLTITYNKRETIPTTITSTSITVTSDVVVTFNAKDFPNSTLSRAGDTISIQLSNGGDGITGLVKKA